MQLAVFMQGAVPVKPVDVPDSFRALGDLTPIVAVSVIFVIGAVVTIWLLTRDRASERERFTRSLDKQADATNKLAESHSAGSIRHAENDGRLVTLLEDIKGGQVEHGQKLDDHGRRIDELGRRIDTRLSIGHRNPHEVEVHAGTNNGAA